MSVLADNIYKSKLVCQYWKNVRFIFWLDGHFIYYIAGNAKFVVGNANCIQEYNGIICT